MHSWGVGFVNYSTGMGQPGGTRRLKERRIIAAPDSQKARAGVAVLAAANAVWEWERRATARYSSSWAETPGGYVGGKSRRTIPDVALGAAARP